MQQLTSCVTRSHEAEDAFACKTHSIHSSCLLCHLPPLGYLTIIVRGSCPSNLAFSASFRTADWDLRILFSQQRPVNQMRYLASCELKQRVYKTALCLSKLQHGLYFIIDILQKPILVPHWLPSDTVLTLTNEIFAGL